MVKQCHKQMTHTFIMFWSNWEWFLCCILLGGTNKHRHRRVPGWSPEGRSLRSPRLEASAAPVASGKHHLAKTGRFHREMVRLPGFHYRFFFPLISVFSQWLGHLLGWWFTLLTNIINAYRIRTRIPLLRTPHQILLDESPVNGCRHLYSLT